MKEQQQQEQPPRRKGLSSSQLILLAIGLLAVLYFLQKSGCPVLQTKDRLEWIDR